MFILVFPQFSLHSVFLFTFPACFLPAFISFWYYLSLPLILGCSFLKMTGASIFPATAPLSPATGASSCQAHSPDGFFVSVLQWWHAVPVLHRGTAWALLQGEEELAMHRAGFCLPFFSSSSSRAGYPPWGSPAQSACPAQAEPSCTGCQEWGALGMDLL